MKQSNKEAERDTLHSEISLQLHEELKKVMNYEVFIDQRTKPVTLRQSK